MNLSNLIPSRAVRFSFLATLLTVAVLGNPFIQLLSSRAVKPLPVGLFSDFENSTAGTPLDNTIFGNGTHGSGAAMTIIATNGLVSSDQSSFVAGVNIGGTYWPANTGTRAVKWTNGVSGNYGRYNLSGTDPDSVTVAGMVNFGSNSNDAGSFAQIDHVEIGSIDGGSFAVMQLRNNPQIVFAHTSGGAGGNISVSTNKWYWFNVHRTVGGSGKVAIFDPELGFTQVGSTSESTGMSTNKTRNIYIGVRTTHAVFAASEVKFDNVVIDYTGTWPLVPTL